MTQQLSRLRQAGIAALVLLLGACAGETPPRNVENACAIFREKPLWADAIAASERKWGAPAEVQLAIMWRESSFVSDARPPKDYVLGVVPWGRKSSAYGYSQAINGTWDMYRRSTGNRGAERERFDDAADFVGWYMARTNRVNGVEMTDAYNQYLAYHEGHAGYRNGSYRSKDWLRAAARQVRNRAGRYAQQLRGCADAYAGSPPRPVSG